MSRGRQKNNIVTFRKGIRINIGVIAFLLILIYLLFNCIIYFNKPRISVYEVTQREISDDYSCTGVILREEEIVQTKDNGYLNYYYGESDRIGKNATVYTVDETGEIYNLLKASDNNASLSKDERALLWDNIVDFRKVYTKDNYQSVSDFVYNVENTVLELSNSTLSGNIEDILVNNNITSSYKNVISQKSGIISYSIDGYEDLTEEKITPDIFEMKDYTKEQLRVDKKVKSGQAAYKLVTSEDWNIVLNLSKELYDKLKEKEDASIQEGKTTIYITLTLTKENFTVTVPYHTFTKENGYYANLKMSNYVVHYIEDRFIEVEIEFASVEGLKIPVSSILKKEFYTVPNKYFTEGGNSNKTGLVKEVYDKSGEKTYSFVETSAYYVSEDGMAYVDKSLFSSGEWICNEQTQERYQIGARDNLKGVYNVNEGYCSFKHIEILYKNEEYCIVSPSTEQGLSPFDHIIVDATTVTEDALINSFKSE